MKGWSRKWKSHRPPWRRNQQLYAKEMKTGWTTWLAGAWLVAAVVFVLGAVGIALLANGHMEIGTLALVLALSCLGCALLWNWKL